LGHWDSGTSLDAGDFRCRIINSGAATGYLPDHAAPSGVGCCQTRRDTKLAECYWFKADLDAAMSFLMD
jgi:hypothetical protein